MAHALAQLWIDPQVQEGALLFDGLRGAGEAAHAAAMLPHALFVAQAEHRGAAVGPLVGADALEGADPVVHGVRQHVIGGVVPRDQLAVEPDRVDLLDAHAGCLPTPAGVIKARDRYSSVDDRPLHREQRVMRSWLRSSGGAADARLDMPRRASYVRPGFYPPCAICTKSSG